MNVETWWQTASVDQSIDQPRGRILSIRRALVSLAVGIAVGALVAALAAWELFLLVSWTATASVILAWVWRIGWPQDGDGTKRLAEEESRSRYSADMGIVIAAVASIGIIALALVSASSNRDPIAVVLVILSVVAVALSWALVNTVFALKYARLYYRDERDGGIDFGREQTPAYTDFVYVAFTVGMSYATAEGRELHSTQIRKVALAHALLSYLFGTVILAVAVNLVTNLGQS